MKPRPGRKARGASPVRREEESLSDRLAALSQKATCVEDDALVAAHASYKTDASIQSARTPHQGRSTPRKMVDWLYNPVCTERRPQDQ